MRQSALQKARLDALANVVWPAQPRSLWEARRSMQYLHWPTPLQAFRLDRPIASRSRIWDRLSLENTAIGSRSSLALAQRKARKFLLTAGLSSGIPAAFFWALQFSTKCKAI